MVVGAGEYEHPPTDEHYLPPEEHYLPPEKNYLPPKPHVEEKHAPPKESYY